MDLIAEGFGDCSAETTISKGTINAHVPEYERCQRVIKPTGDCDIIHSLGISSTVENVYVASKGRTWYTVQFDLKWVMERNISIRRRTKSCSNPYC